MVESVLGVWLRAILGKKEGFLMFVGFVGGLEKESWGALAVMSLVSNIAERTGKVFV